MYNYHTVIINYTGDFFFDSTITSCSFTSNEQGYIMGEIEIPINLYVINTNNRPVNFAFQEGQILTTYKPLVITNKITSLIKSKVSDNYEYSLLSPNVKKVNNFEKLNFSKVYNSEVSSIVNFFKINDLVSVEIQKYENGKQIESIKRIVNITNITKTDTTIKLTVEGESYKLKKLPVSISTKPDTETLLSFLEKFIIYYALKYTELSVIKISTKDYNTFSNSNMGAYRSNVCNFDFLMSKLFKEYNINFIYDTQNINQMFITYGNTQLNDMIIVNNYQSISDADIKQIDNTTQPVIVRATSLATSEAVAKQNKTDKNTLAEVLYGDIEALSNNGTIINLKLANLTKESLTERARKQYIRQKYLFNVNSITSKNKLYNKTVIHYYDLWQQYNTGYYYIMEVTHKFTIEDGYTCYCKLGVRFNNIEDLNNITKL